MEKGFVQNEKIRGRRLPLLWRFTCNAKLIDNMTFWPFDDMRIFVSFRRHLFIIGYGCIYHQLTSDPISQKFRVTFYPPASLRF